MAVTKPTYTAATNLAVTTGWGTGLTNGLWGCSAVVDNQTTAYMDVLVGGLIEQGTTTPAAGDTYDIYIVGIYDELTAAALGGGIDALLTGVDAIETEGTDFDSLNLKFVTSVAAEANVGYHWGPEGLAQHFGGVMPPKWALLINNNSATADMASGSLVEMIGIHYTSS